MTKYQAIAKCRGCGVAGNWYDFVLSLGQQYVVDFVKDENGDYIEAPLDLIKCKTCHLLQLKHSVNPDRLYSKFWYKSGINESMRDALRNIVTAGLEVVSNPKRALDIGSNDGTLLSYYRGTKVRTVGIDPCRDLVMSGHNEGRIDIAINGYFSAKAVRPFGPYDIITAIAMFYDVEDPTRFLKDCKDVLTKDGVIIIQMNYLKGMLEQCAVDNICHEHLTYFSLTSLMPCIEKAGLELVGAETNDVNGGSIRVYLMHKGKALQCSANKQMSLYTYGHSLLIEEDKMGLDTSSPYNAFALRTRSVFDRLRHYLGAVDKAGGRVYVYGASTRGTTLMQCLRLPYGLIKGAAERDASKFGLKMMGTWIPIESEEYCRRDATHFLVLPWHFLNTIKLREKIWLENGGRFIVPLPEPKIVTSSEELPIYAATEAVQ